jgi:hypothetical protein
LKISSIIVFGEICCFDTRALWVDLLYIVHRGLGCLDAPS